jgi:hypothetical protein
MRLILILFVATIAVGCILSDDYGSLRIQAPSGEEFYFRRQTRGLNYDALSLSSNPNVCVKPDPDNALIFRSLGPVEVFYKFEGNELHLYKMSTVDLPKNFSKTIKLVLHDITNPEFIALRKSYADKGLEISTVPLNPKLSCWN